MNKIQAVRYVSIPTTSIVREYGPYFTSRAEGNNATLFLIQHPDEIERGAKCVGLEVSLPASPDESYQKGPTKGDTKRIDLIFVKKNKKRIAYYVVEVESSKQEKSKGVKQAIEAAKLLQLKTPSKEEKIMPIVAYPA